MESRRTNLLRPFFRRGEQGQSIIILALGFIALLAFVGIVTDVSLMFVRYSQLRRAVDSAAIAAAGQMRKDRTLATVNLAARQFIEFHGLDPKAVLVDTCASVPDTNGDGNRDHQDDPQLCPQDQRKLVRVTAQVESPTVFMRLLGWDSVTLEASAVSETAVLDVVILLDVSESMLDETTYEDWANIGLGTVFRPPTFQEIRDAKGWTTTELWQGKDGDPNTSLVNTSQEIVNERLNFVDHPSLNFSDPLIVDEDYVVRSFVPAGYGSQGLPRVDCTVRFFPYSLAFQIEPDVAQLYADAGVPWTGGDRWQGFRPTYNFYGCCNDPGKGDVDLDGSITMLSNEKDDTFEDLICQPFKKARDATRQFLERIDFIRGDRVAFVTFGRSAFILNPYDVTARAGGRNHMIESFTEAVTVLNRYIGVRAEPNFYDWDEDADGAGYAGWSGYAAGFNQLTGDSLPVDYKRTDTAAVTEINDYPVKDDCPFQNAALPYPYSRRPTLPGIMFPNEKDQFGNPTEWAGFGLTVANSYDLWGSCRDTNIGAALREANNALLDPNTSRRSGTVWVMILLSDGAAGASDPVRRNGDKLERTLPYDETAPGSGVFGIRGEYGAFGVCPAGTPSDPGELTDTADEVSTGAVIFPFCSDEEPETRHFCNFRPEQQRQGYTWPTAPTDIRTDNDYVVFPPDQDLNGDGIIQDEFTENFLSGNIYDVDIGTEPTGTSCDDYYDVDDYARDWADFVGLLQPGQSDAQLPTIFTIGFGLDFAAGSSGTPGTPGYSPGPASQNIQDYLGEELLRYIADVGDNFQMDIDYQQDWRDNGALNLQLVPPENFAARSVCEGPGGTKFGSIYASEADMIDPLPPTENCGNYFNAPDQNELQKVFDEIASRMFTQLAG